MKIRIPNKLYDVLKWIALGAIPALEALWLTIAKTWGLPYVTEIATTIAAVGLFIGALIGVSTYNYNAAQEAAAQNTVEILEEVEDGEQSAEGN